MTPGTAPARPVPGAGSPHRVTALDGLRGVAALVVVVHHALLTWPVLFAQYTTPNPASGSWWLTFTPLHLAWAGREAVVLFFVLSGFVLVLPYLSPQPGTWLGYYVRRLLRLYPPVVAAVLLSALLVEAFPRVADAAVSDWYAWHAVEVTTTGLVQELLFLDWASPLNTALWSLRHELIFSAALPLVVVVARSVPRRLAITLPGALALVAIAPFLASPIEQWLPTFLVGAALALGHDDLLRLGRRIEAGRYRAGAWWCVASTAVACTLAEWWCRGLGVPESVWVIAAPPLVAFGCSLICFLVLGCPSVRRIFSGRFLQWAGRISFSLYLVHEPIVVSVSGLAGPGIRGVVVTVLAGGLASVLVAMAFHAVVEAPVQRCSRRIGARIDRRSRWVLRDEVPPVAVPAERVRPWPHQRRAMVDAR